MLNALLDDPVLARLYSGYGPDGWRKPARPSAICGNPSACFRSPPYSISTAVTYSDSKRAGGRARRSFG